MPVKIKGIILLIWIFWQTGQPVISQDQTSRNNYTGNWDLSESWNPSWANPTANINGYNITINGYITLNTSLQLTGTGNLTVNDTLVIFGDISMSNNYNLTVNDNAIIIVKGNFIFDNKTAIISNGYIIIDGNLTKTGSEIQGSFTSNDNPVHVFVGGTITPVDLTNNPNFPPLNCASPPTNPYLNSGCSYGNKTDLKNDPIYPFYQNICTTTPAITAGGPTTFCSGNSVTLSSSAGTGYLWSNGEITPSITVKQSGNYTVKVSNSSGCFSLESNIISVTVNQPPLVSITSSNNILCEFATRNLIASPEGGIFRVLSGPGSVAGNVITATGVGNILLEYKYTQTCSNSDTINIATAKSPVANPGPDQVLKNVFETTMNASLSASETGKWSLVSGMGIIDDIYSPTSIISGLSTGENIFLWTVQNADCTVDAEIKIQVGDLILPTVITPNGDGKNDYFKIGEIFGKVEFIVFNQWGDEVYRNNNYLNNWDGKNNKNVDLPNDTYFYILKFSNGKITKGSLLIKR